MNNTSILFLTLTSAHLDICQNHTEQHAKCQSLSVKLALLLRLGNRVGSGLHWDPREVDFSKPLGFFTPRLIARDASGQTPTRPEEDRPDSAPEGQKQTRFEIHRPTGQRGPPVFQ